MSNQIKLILSLCISVIINITFTIYTIFQQAAEREDIVNLEELLKPSEEELKQKEEIKRYREAMFKAIGEKDSLSLQVEELKNKSHKDITYIKQRNENNSIDSSVVSDSVTSRLARYRERFHN